MYTINRDSFIYAALVIVLSLNVNLYGQVINDGIEHRIELMINSSISSSTADCTLQWECLNHQLTKKCIQYHNDQWFYLKTSNLDKYYLNISNQNCRDIRGIQLLVIGGIACEPESYKVMKCISLGNQDDIFITLDGLENQKEYLILVDGYLHDFCAFDIQFSDKPKGIPISEKAVVDLSTKLLADYHVEVSWSVPDTIASLVNKYELYRLNETAFKSEKVHEINQSYNAYGIPRLDYVIDDVIPDYGKFYYNVIGVGDNDRMLISKLLIHYPRPKSDDKESKNWIEVDLHYPKACKLKISIFDAKNHSLLYWMNFNYSSENRFFEYFIKEYRDEGITNYRIDILNLETDEKSSQLIIK